MFLSFRQVQKHQLFETPKQIKSPLLRSVIFAPKELTSHSLNVPLAFPLGKGEREIRFTSFSDEWLPSTSKTITAETGICYTGKSFRRTFPDVLWLSYCSVLRRIPLKRYVHPIRTHSSAQQSKIVKLSSNLMLSGQCERVQALCDNKKSSTQGRALFVGAGDGN